MRASVAMSVALHAGVIAMVVLGHREPASDPLAAAAAVVLEPAPVAITLWTEPVPAPATGGLPAPGSVVVPARRVRVERIAPPAAPSVAPAGAAPTVPSATDVPRPGHSLAMRDGADLRIHELREEPSIAAAHPPRESPEPVAPLTRPAGPDSGEPDSHQTHEAFAMTVEGDGTAHLQDRRNLRWVLGVPTKKAVRDRIDAWQDELAHAYSGETVDYSDERPIEHPIGSIGATVMKFDVTDWAMRAHGEDPYASAKLAQLDATRGERMQAGARYRERELGNAGTLMAHNLDRLWTTVPDLVERKRELFALWDECSETGTDADIEAGVRARARVIAFIRAHLPEGGVGAFTPAELAAFNRAKQSHEQFAPYAE